jgi:hypothetical protein
MTLKYKATERYAFGWTDPRGIFGNGGLIKMDNDTRFAATEFKDTPTEVLRNLWLIKFGSRHVAIDVLQPLNGDDIIQVGQELANRKLLRYEKLNDPMNFSSKEFYVLEKEDGNH